MKKIWITSAVLTAVIMVGCGESSNSEEKSSIDLPNAKTLIFLDNVSSKQYQYNTDTEKYENMNVAGKNYDMSGKNGRLIVWNHKTSSGVSQKIVMVDENFDIIDGNLTHEDLHYIGHFHENNNVKYFAAHSADEFNPDHPDNMNVDITRRLGALKVLNKHLIEQNEIKEKIAEALPSTETLCNFFVLKQKEASAHIALTASGKIYMFKESKEELEQSQSIFTLDGVTECKENESGIIRNDDHGVLIFTAQSQKLYLVDTHGEDFHVHSTWDTDRFLASGFTPTIFTGISKEDDKHGHEHH